MSNRKEILLELDGDNSCSVNLFGATIVSWISQKEEMLFVSSKSHFDNIKAIRGGIPIVFPNFGPWELGPQHGFARINMWKVAVGPTHSNGECRAVLELVDDDKIRAMWNYSFKLRYIITLRSDSLHCQFEVTNTGLSTFHFTCLLHTYFKTPDVTKTAISGLAEVTYTDKVQGGTNLKENREIIYVAENVDRIYENTPNEQIVNNLVGGRSIKLVKENLPDTVVWNPWIEKAAAMADFGDDEYPSMICVEAGHVANPVAMNGGETFTCSQSLIIQ